jgi:hypothetical protein
MTPGTMLVVAGAAWITLVFLVLTIAVYVFKIRKRTYQI